MATRCAGPARAPDAGAAWERRWDAVWQAFFAAMLGVPTVLAIMDAPTRGHAAATVTVATGLGAWHWATALRRPDWEGRPAMLLWFAGVVAFTWVLLGRHDSYAFMVYGLYPQLFSLLGRWAVPGVALLTVAVLWRTGVLAAQSLSGWGLIVGASVLSTVFIGLFVTALVRRSADLQEALEELEATRAELAATARRAGVLEERERMAREVHDTVAQGFTGIVMQLEAAEQAFEADRARAREHLDRARSSARASLAEVRRAVHDLRPEALDGATLAQALNRTARRWEAETGIPATAVTTGTARALSPEAEIALLRTAREALANVAKHAGANTVTLRLAYSADAVVLAVEDDGAGFDPNGGAGGGGVGLRGMGERMIAVGGRLTVESAPGAGTRVAAEVPAP